MKILILTAALLLPGSVVGSEPLFLPREVNDEGRNIERTVRYGSGRIALPAEGRLQLRSSVGYSIPNCEGVEGPIQSSGVAGSLEVPSGDSFPHSNNGAKDPRDHRNYLYLPREIETQPKPSPPPRGRVVTHSHRCPYDGTVWWHDDSSYGSVRDHRCPTCGRVQWSVYQRGMRVIRAPNSSYSSSEPRYRSLCPT